MCDKINTSKWLYLRELEFNFVVWKKDNRNSDSTVDYKWM